MSQDFEVESSRLRDSSPGILSSSKRSRHAESWSFFKRIYLLSGLTRISRDSSQSRVDEVYNSLIDLDINIKDREVFEASEIFTNINENNLDEIRDRFSIPAGIKLLCGVQFPTVDHPSHYCIAINRHSMYAGLIIPFHPFFALFIFL